MAVAPSATRLGGFVGFVGDSRVSPLGRGIPLKPEARARLLGRCTARRVRPEARARAVEIFQRLNTLEPGAVAAEDLTPEELPFLYRRAKRSRSFLPETRKSRNPTPRRFNVWRMLKRTR